MILYYLLTCRSGKKIFRLNCPPPPSSDPADGVPVPACHPRPDRTWTEDDRQAAGGPPTKPAAAGQGER